MSLTDNEIINAWNEEIHLANYVNEDYRNGINISLIKNTLDLINRQKAEIERLNRCNWHMSNDLREEINRNIRLQAEIEELLVELERFKKIETTVNAFWSELQKITTFKKKSKPTLEELLEYMENLKAEVINELAHRSENRIATNTDISIEQYQSIIRDISEACKEMVGDTE